MKTFLFSISAVLILMVNSYDLSAQKTGSSYDPSAQKVLVDNDYITAIEVTFEPGKMTPSHTHPAHFVYALAGGTLLVTMENGETKLYTLKTGESAYIDPEGPHRTINNGKEPVKILLVEFKDKPYMADMKTKK